MFPGDGRINQADYSLPPDIQGGWHYLSIINFNFFYISYNPYDPNTNKLL